MTVDSCQFLSIYFVRRAQWRKYTTFGVVKTAVQRKPKFEVALHRGFGNPRRTYDRRLGKFADVANLRRTSVVKTAVVKISLLHGALAAG